MTIELITGTPGAGKTTFAVAERVAVECVRKLKMDDGTEYTRRVLTAGVRGLVLEHERLPHKLTGEKVSDTEVEFYNAMESGDTPKFQRLAGYPPVLEIEGPDGNKMPVRQMVQNWWLWCQPGDLIVVDEAQFLAPRGTLGKKPVYWIQALEIHRHYGVDFIIITQHPQLIDTTIRNLVGLHRHVRAVMGSPMCMTYTWDHASNPERAQLANKKAWMRRAKHYRLFHSSVAHVKPPNSGRAVLFIIPALLLTFWLGLAQFSKRFTADSVAAPVVADAASVPGLPGSAPLPGPLAAPELRIVGCVSGQGGGYCIDNTGGRVDLPPDVARWNAEHMGGKLRYSLEASPPSVPPAPPASSAYLASIPPMRSEVGATGAPASPSIHDGSVLADMK